MNDSTTAIRKLTVKNRDLLAACFDLLNDDITGPEWMQYLADLAQCKSASCIWWRTGRPDTYLVDSCGNEVIPPRSWIEFVDSLVDEVSPQEPFFIDTALTSSLGRPASIGIENGFHPDKLVACVDWEPARVVFIFSDKNDSPHWLASDRENLASVLPTIRKSVSIKKELSSQRDILELANKVNDSRASAMIAMTPEQGIITTNRLADELLNNGDLVQVADGKFSFSSKEQQSEFEFQLAILNEMSNENISDFCWYDSISKKGEKSELMITMRGICKDYDRRESSIGNRMIMLTLEKAASRKAPHEMQLQKFYGLSKAQARFTRALMLSDNLEAAANACNITINTARTHMRAIYRKCGVDSQGKLMQLLANID